jgi:hypothetical protein
MHHWMQHGDGNSRGAGIEKLPAGDGYYPGGDVSGMAEGMWGGSSQASAIDGYVEPPIYTAVGVNEE